MKTTEKTDRGDRWKVYLALGLLMAVALLLVVYVSPVWLWLVGIVLLLLFALKYTGSRSRPPGP